MPYLSPYIEPSSTSEVCLLVARVPVPASVWSEIICHVLFSPPLRRQLDGAIRRTRVTVDVGEDILTIGSLKATCRFFRNLINRSPTFSASFIIALPLTSVPNNITEFISQIEEGQHQSATVRLFIDTAMDTVTKQQRRWQQGLLNQVLSHADDVVVHGQSARQAGTEEAIAARFFGNTVRLPRLRSLVLDTVRFETGSTGIPTVGPLLSLLRLLPTLETLHLFDVVAGAANEIKDPIDLPHLSELQYRGDLPVFEALATHIITTLPLRLSLELPPADRVPGNAVSIASPHPLGSIMTPCLIFVRLHNISPGSFERLSSLLERAESLELDNADLDPLLWIQLDVSSFPFLRHLRLSRCTFDLDDLKNFVTSVPTAIFPAQPYSILSFVNCSPRSHTPIAVLDWLQDRISEVHWYDEGTGLDVHQIRVVASAVDLLAPAPCSFSEFDLLDAWDADEDVYEEGGEWADFDVDGEGGDYDDLDEIADEVGEELEVELALEGPADEE